MQAKGNSAPAAQMKMLTDRKVRELVDEKRRLVEVPYTATLAHTMNTLVANRVVAVPVAAPPGHWIGAGGSMIMEADKHTGAVRKHYIGMVTMLDVLAHIAGDDAVNGGEGTEDVDRKLSVPVSTIIGQSLEGLSLWTLNPNTNILDCMEVFCKGIHRAMVPLDSHMENISGVELMESASCYRMLTQMDVIKFVKAQHDFHDILCRMVRDAGAITDTVFAVSQQMRATDAIKCIKTMSLQAVPIVEAPKVPQEALPQLINGYGKKLIGTFSATDLRGCPVSQLSSWLKLNVMEFTARVFENPSSHGAQDLVIFPRVLVTCQLDSTLSEVIDKLVSRHVHRVWVTNEEGMLLGLVSLTDIIRVIRAHVLALAEAQLASSVGHLGN
ncbi:hypothetical protein Cgig2_014578 [Carnegiea gigantea]|uniref:CBS domain-containing protein n=1 Tax=Carnegiea gigantea TaxID=171969 RepID=A0A9Q1L199_9CARY|nr:hypothetical protein Cgig2_014578 [Carnegiea gigantea]